MKTLIKAGKMVAFLLFGSCVILKGITPHFIQALEDSVEKEDIPLSMDDLEPAMAENQPKVVTEIIQNPSFQKYIVPELAVELLEWAERHDYLDLAKNIITLFHSRLTHEADLPIEFLLHKSQDRPHELAPVLYAILAHAPHLLTPDHAPMILIWAIRSGDTQTLTDVARWFQDGIDPLKAIDVFCTACEENNEEYIEILRSLFRNHFKTKIIQNYLELAAVNFRGLYKTKVNHIRIIATEFYDEVTRIFLDIPSCIRVALQGAIINQNTEGLKAITSHLKSAISQEDALLALSITKKGNLKQYAKIIQSTFFPKKPCWIVRKLSTLRTKEASGRQR